ncbi:peptide deformylase [Streptomyces sp. A1547]|uniref:peptide deformylase n=1 Tax=Streptomyces sp. A1547 TaxID=2563105 RepID=UPI00109E38EA|nr:peptide deformylase [Streptomyces sp. A1547]THA38141.1 peptide deformylase [Streptomyces sp. A1547]
MSDARPSDTMRALGVVQAEAQILHRPTRAFDLPAEREAAQQVLDQLFAAAARISEVHPFAKGMGIAAPQIDVDRAAAIVQPAEAGADPIILLNPRIVSHSDETDEQFEGCLSFFDVRGLVPRPLTITVEHTSLDGSTAVATYHQGLARLVHHEIDHLDGYLYEDRMRDGVAPISVAEYRQTGSAWSY